MLKCYVKKTTLQVSSHALLWSDTSQGLVSNYFMNKLLTVIATVSKHTAFYIAKE